MRGREEGSVGSVNRVGVGNVGGRGKERGIKRGDGGEDGAIVSLTPCSGVRCGFVV